MASYPMLETLPQKAVLSFRGVHPQDVRLLTSMELDFVTSVEDLSSSSNKPN